MKVSIVIACYNEERTLARLLDRVLAVSLPDATKEVLIIDDGSTDSSPAIAEDYARRHPGIVRTFRSARNQGKGAAIRTGFRHATGDILITQDADLEYDPQDYRAILDRFRDPQVQVVYGSRILGSLQRSYHRYYWGGRLLTLATNLLYGSRLTDEPTGYKAVRREVLAGLDLVAQRFDFCPELTAKLLRRGYRIHEVPIRYQPRSFEEGKKISWWDGLVGLYTLLRYRLA